VPNVTKKRKPHFELCTKDLEKENLDFKALYQFRLCDVIYATDRFEKYDSSLRRGQRRGIILNVYNLLKKERKERYKTFEHHRKQCASSSFEVKPLRKTNNFRHFENICSNFLRVSESRVSCGLFYRSVMKPCFGRLAVRFVNYPHNTQCWVTSPPPHPPVDRRFIYSVDGICNFCFQEISILVCGLKPKASTKQ
jgi:hypothetical protein